MLVICNQIGEECRKNCAHRKPHKWMHIYVSCVKAEGWKYGGVKFCGRYTIGEPDNRCIEIKEDK